MDIYSLTTASDSAQPQAPHYSSVTSHSEGASEGVAERTMAGIPISRSEGSATTGLSSAVLSTDVRQVATRRTKKIKANSKIMLESVIAGAIGRSPTKKMSIDEIYQYLMVNHPDSCKSKNWKSNTRKMLLESDRFMEVLEDQNRKITSIWKVNPDTQPAVDETVISKTKSPLIDWSKLIKEAILSSPWEKMKIGEIYKFIETNHRDVCVGNWKGKIRSNLSLSKNNFVKCGPSKEYGNYWTLAVEHPQQDAPLMAPRAYQPEMSVPGQAESFPFSYTPAGVSRA